MSNIDKFKTLLLTAAAAAAVQSCTDSSAELVDASSASAAADRTAMSVCPLETLAVSVGSEVHCRLEGRIDADVHLFAGPTYQLAGAVEIGAPLSALGEGRARTLSIDPGVQIYGADRSAALIIARGSRIEARGRESAPIVFTSAYDLGFDDELGLPARSNIAAPRGEWRGLAINGLSDVNGVDGSSGAVCAENAGDIYCERQGEAGAGLYGGAAGSAHSSGDMTHVQIRFAGAYAALSDASLHGAAGSSGARRAPALLLQGVGAGGTFSHLTITNTFGDGLKILGGWVEVSDLAVIGAGDDGVEWSFGYRGALRDVVTAADARLGDADNGFEGSNSDLDSEAHMPASSPSRITNPIVSNPRLINVAAIGDAAVSDAGVALARGTDVTIQGAVISGGFARAGLDFDGAETYQRVSSADLAGLQVTTPDQSLSTDFDDEALAALFEAGDNTTSGAPVLLADALIAVERRVAPVLARQAPSQQQPASNAAVPDKVETAPEAAPEAPPEAPPAAAPPQDTVAALSVSPAIELAGAISEIPISTSSEPITLIDDVAFDRVSPIAPVAL